MKKTLVASLALAAAVMVAPAAADAATSWTTVKSDSDRDYTRYGSTFTYVYGSFENAPVRAVVRSTPGRVRVGFDIDCYDGNYDSTYSKSWRTSYRSRGFNRPFRRVVSFTPGSDVYDWGYESLGFCSVSVDAWGPKGRANLRLQVPA